MVISRHFPKYQELDQLVMDGRAQLIGTPTVDTGTVPVMVECQAGQVAIITKIVGMVYPSNDTSPGLSDVGAAQGFFLYDENGDLTNEGMKFLAFQKVDAAMGVSPSDEANSWKSAVPNAPLVWEFEQPLIVPPRHKLRAAMDSANTMAGGTFACYGYIVDEGTARQLGFSVLTQDATIKSASGRLVNKQGFRGGVVTATGALTLVEGLTNHCIQVIDVCMRAQPMAGGSTTRVGILAGGALATDPLLQIVNNNHGDMAEVKIAPGWYLEPGDPLVLATLTDARCSVAITYRYVPKSEVPEGVWRACFTPQYPTPGGFSTGTTSLYNPVSHTILVKYPGAVAASRSVTTATTPGVGYQHVVEGYVINGQKDTTFTSDRWYLALTQGASASGVGLSGSGLTGTNKLISPILCLGSHNQMLALAVDGLNIPCLKDTGAVRIDSTSTGAGAASPAAADLDTDEIFVSVWGRTIPSRFGEGHFQGAAS